MSLAVDLFEKDRRHQEQEARDASMVAAAREVGVPEAYLERARALYRQQQRSLALKKRIAAGAVVGLVAAGGITVIASPGPPPAPWVESFDGAQDRWTLAKNGETTAALRFESRDGRGEVAVLAVDRFGPDGDGRYQANLDSLGPVDLERHRGVRFAVRGDGLGTIRLYLESPAERWRSPPLSVGAEWREHQLSLDRFEHQTRGPGGAWKVGGAREPGKVQKLSFKLGHFINDSGAAGRVEIDDLRIE